MQEKCSDGDNIHHGYRASGGKTKKAKNILTSTPKGKSEQRKRERGLESWKFEN